MLRPRTVALPWQQFSRCPKYGWLRRRTRTQTKQEGTKIRRSESAGQPTGADLSLALAQGQAVGAHVPTQDGNLRPWPDGMTGRRNDKCRGTPALPRCFDNPQIWALIRLFDPRSLSISIHGVFINSMGRAKNEERNQALICKLLHINGLNSSLHQTAQNQRPNSEGFKGEIGKFSRPLSEILPQRALIKRGRSVICDGFQIIRAFCGIHDLGGRRDLGISENVHQRNLELAVAALQSDVVPLR